MATATPLRFCLCPTDLGWIALLFSPRGLRAATLPLPSHEDALQRAMALGASEPASPAEAGDLPRRLQDYARGRPVRFDDLTIDWDGLSQFRRAVLRQAMAIPRGETRSYRWLAERVGQPQAARAVGRVMATNPLPIIIPCHRVVASDGSLRGYGGGLSMKERLLRLEGTGGGGRPKGSQP